MTDILTKEERETVERLRQYIEMPLRSKKSGRLAKSYCDNLLNHTRSLFDILDNLSKRGVKKYSEEELRTAFRAMIQRNVIMLTAEQTTMVEAGWLDCARFLGALEEK